VFEAISHNVLFVICSVIIQESFCHLWKLIKGHLLDDLSFQLRVGVVHACDVDEDEAENRRKDILPLHHRMASKPDDVLSRLTDPSKYTGSHKNRFDPVSGKGKGIDGRTDRVSGDGYVVGYKASKATGTTVPEKSDVLDRLTDPSKYTGAHKARFDSDGKGLGVNQTVDKDVPRDLSDMTRPELRGAKPKPSLSPSPSGSGIKKSPSKKPEGDSIFDRLSNPASYTGAHKHRFDASGKGKGILIIKHVVLTTRSPLSFPVDLTTGIEGRVDRADSRGYVQGSKI